MKRASGIWVILVAGGLAVSLAFFSPHLPARSLIGFAEALSVIFGALTTLWIHDIGHAIGAAIAGLKVRGVYLWPYYIRLTGAPRVSVLPLNHWLHGGDFELRSWVGARGRLVTSLLSGLLASLALVLVAKGLQGSVPPLRDQPILGMLLHHYLLYLPAIALIHLVFELLPIRSISTFWDGAFLLDLLRGGETERRSIAQFMMHREAAGKRPRDWNAELLEACREDSNSTERNRWIQWNYYYHLDRGELQECQRWVDLGFQAWNARRDLDASIIRAERVYLAHRLNADEFDFGAAFEDLHYTDEWWFSWHRARVVTCLREGKKRDALYYAVADRRTLNKVEEQPDYVLEVDLWDLLVEECVAASANDAATESTD